MKALELLEMVESAGLVGNGIEMQKLVEELGGWDVVLNAWKATGGRAEAFANVWSMVVHLSNGQAEFAERMQVPLELVSGYVESLKAMVVTRRAGEAEVALQELCAAIAAGYEDLAATPANTTPATDTAELGAWWRARSDEMARLVLSSTSSVTNVAFV